MAQGEAAKSFLVRVHILEIASAARHSGVLLAWHGAVLRWVIGLAVLAVAVAAAALLAVLQCKVCVPFAQRAALLEGCGCGHVLGRADIQIVVRSILVAPERSWV